MSPISRIAIAFQLWVVALFVVLSQLPQAASQEFIGPRPYTRQADSPFLGMDFKEFFVEDFEDHQLNTPGVTASAGDVTSVAFGSTKHDSVDADDGVIDGSGLKGDSFFSEGTPGIRFSFDAEVLGGNPTHVGIVWTDGGGVTTFEAFDSRGESLGKIGPTAIADGETEGTTGDDHFFGVIHAAGVASILISNTEGGIEVDHLQYNGHLDDRGIFQKDAAVKQVRLTRLDGGKYVVLSDTVEYGETVYVEVVFDGQPRDAMRYVEIALDGDTIDSVPVFETSTSTLYRSHPLLLDEPDWVYE